MWHSLELRVPFLDHPLVEFCQTVPTNLKIRRTSKKYLLKKLAARWVPGQVLDHRKQGFESPMAALVARADLKNYISAALSPERLAVHGFFRPGIVQDILRRHLGGRETLSKQLFTLLMFQKWYQHNYSRSGRLH